RRECAAMQRRRPPPGDADAPGLVNGDALQLLVRGFAHTNLPRALFGLRPAAAAVLPRLGLLVEFAEQERIGTFAHRLKTVCGAIGPLVRLREGEASR